MLSCWVCVCRAYPLQPEDEDLVEFLVSLRAAILEAYNGILTGYGTKPGCGEWRHMLLTLSLSPSTFIFLSLWI